MLRTCTAADCENPVRSSGLCLCNKHYQRVRKHGHLYLEDRPRGKTKLPRDNVRIDAAGYVWIFVGDNRVKEHRHLAEKALGKPLPPQAVVHHMNKIKHDNKTPFNLILCPNEEYHKLLHKRMKAYDLGLPLPME